MSKRKAIAIWTVLVLAILATAAAIALLHRRQPVTLRGAILRQDRDPNRQLPLADVQITAVNTGKRQFQVRFFRLFHSETAERSTAPSGGYPRFPARRHRPLDVNDFIGDKIYIERMVPLHQDTVAESRSGSAISNTRIRYSVKATTDADVGSAVKTFQIVNTGNTPCNNHPPCAPGGKWKATVGSLSLDAGEGNEFRNARVSCIAGPCPFTKIEVENFSPDRRRFNVSVLNWSDTVTFLLEAEVVHPMTSDMVRETYRVVNSSDGPLFGCTLQVIGPCANRLGHSVTSPRERCGPIGRLRISSLQLSAIGKVLGSQPAVA